MHRFHFCFNFGCYVVLIFALSFSLDTHAVFLGFSVLPIRSRIFLSFFLLYMLSFQLRRDTHRRRLQRFFVLRFLLSFLCRKSCIIHSHLVLGRFRLKLLNNTSIVFLVICTFFRI